MDTIKIKNIDGVKYITLDEHRQAMSELADAYGNGADEKDAEIKRLNNIIDRINGYIDTILEINEKYDYGNEEGLYSKEWVKQTFEELQGRIYVSKAKVGDYIRIKPDQCQKCGIDRITEIEDRGSYKWYHFEKYNGCCSNLENFISKFSSNLIDLIEKGDYVNGYKVDFVQNGEVIYNRNHPYKLNLMAKDIETVVTKEQFENMEYKETMVEDIDEE